MSQTEEFFYHLIEKYLTKLQFFYTIKTPDVINIFFLMSLLKVCQITQAETLGVHSVKI